MSNLATRLQDEVARNEVLVEDYKSIGPAGTFGAALIQAEIDTAVKAAAAGDCVLMLKCYEKLKGNE